VEVIMMDKLKMETPDLTQKNIEKIGSIFPNVITEMKAENGVLKKGINFELLKQELSGDVVDGEECYDFTWVGKKAAIVEGNTPIRKTLRPCIEESKDWENTENLYIEGDNLDVLKLLQESYLNSIKMIYIDPPYNTGNDFIYKDNFTVDKDEYNEQLGIFDEEENRLIKNTDTNGRFHSDWCSMLYSRLKLSLNLMTDDGVILINMDENEIDNLQKLCKEVFGEANELGTIVWDKRNPKGDAKGISYQHEYILIYAKDKEAFLKNNVIKRPKKNAKILLNKAAQIFSKVNDDNYTLKKANKEFSSWVKAQKKFSGGEKAYCNIDENGDVYRPVSMAWPNKKKAPDDYFVPLIHPITKRPCPVPARGWRNPSATMQMLIEKGQILFGDDETTQPTRKYLLKDNMYENIPSLLYFGGSDTDLLKELQIPFDTPKVVSVCMEHIQSFSKGADIILDFFSGSATTAHAVIQANALDGESRKFIMVQLPETVEKNSEAYRQGFKNVSDIGKERIRKSAEKIKIELDNNANSCLDLGFRVLKVDSTNMKDVYYAASEYTQDMIGSLESNIKEDRTDLDLLYGVLLDWGLPLSLSHEIEDIEEVCVHTVDKGSLIACFAEQVSEKIVREIAKRKPLRVVFRDSSFTNSPDKINVEEIFKLLTPNTTVKVI
jgi:adenine-specific DNA-methyltransferase